MAKYNIILKSGGDDYLWNGKSFDKIGDEDREVLLYSGKSVKEDEVDEAIKQSKEAASKLFSSSDTEIKSVQVKVG